MANIKSAKKAIRVHERNRLRNLSHESPLKSKIKGAITAIEENPENAKEIVKAALQLIDKTAAKGVIKKGTAARKKSRLSKKLNEQLKNPTKKAPITKASKPKKSPAKPKKTTPNSSPTETETTTETQTDPSNATETTPKT